jgi:murein DD-endopeptidase MepM/ murein hydrolase activator NlpD
VNQTVVETNLPKIKKIIGSQPAPEAVSAASQPKEPFIAPLDRVGERATKKPFGIFITPQNSPVQPEKFRGFHTGTDFEIFPEELNVDVPVKAICDGKIAVKKTATGYGGVLVESCILENNPVMVVYGHLKLTSIAKKSGDALAQGEEIGILGKTFSAETSGERKHLHLGVHKGSTVNILGYVQSQSKLSGWIDPIRNMSL